MTRLGEWVGQQMGLKMKRAITVINEIYYSYTNYCGLLPIKSDIGTRRVQRNRTGGISLCRLCYLIITMQWS